MRPPSLNDLNFIVESSDMAPADGRAWSHSSIPGGWWVPEEITLVEDSVKLCWDMAGATRWVEPNTDLLEQFLQIYQVELWRPRADAILRFARTWGPLHLCSEHVLPVWHRQDKPGLQAGGLILPVCPPVQFEDGRFAEPLWKWLDYSGFARDVVHASALVRKGKSKPVMSVEMRAVPWLRVKPDRRQLVAGVHSLIEDGGGFSVRPEWPSDEDVPVWRAEVRTLAAALGVGLWNTLRTSRGMAICANCHTLFPIRQRDQRYCPQCTRERWRVNKARARAKPTASAEPDPEYTI